VALDLPARQRGLEGDLTAVLALSHQPLALDQRGRARAARGHVTVCPAGGLGQQRLDRPAADLVRGVAEDLLGGAVAEEDATVLVRGHHAVAREHQDLGRRRLECRSLARRGHTGLLLDRAPSEFALCRRAASLGARRDA
jgi:hypothetical protein